MVDSFNLELMFNDYSKKYFLKASFLIEPDIVAGRMMLLTTLFLVLINLMNNLTSNAPNSEGINAVSAWLLSCIIFVFAALVAYSGILLKNKIRKQKVYKKKNGGGDEITFDNVCLCPDLYLSLFLD